MLTRCIATSGVLSSLMAEPLDERTWFLLGAEPLLSYSPTCKGLESERAMDLGDWDLVLFVIILSLLWLIKSPKQTAIWVPTKNKSQTTFTDGVIAWAAVYSKARVTKQNIILLHEGRLLQFQQLMLQYILRLSSFIIIVPNKALRHAQL